MCDSLLVHVHQMENEYIIGIAVQIIITLIV